MHLFQSARIRLTLWYLLIIALISLSFSAIIYRYVTWELERGFKVAEYRLRGLPIPQERVRILLEDELSEAKHKVLIRLFTINGTIFITAGLAGYFLAGKTLKPIKQMLEKQKRFVADASHELRTPLTSMKTEVEVALRDRKLKMKDAKDLLRSNLSEVDKMKYFTDNLLALSRYEAEGLDLPMEELDLAEAGRQAVERNLPQARKKKISIKNDFSEAVIKGNPQSMVELVSILLNNAIKYSPESKEVTVTIKKSKKTAIIEVKDEGVGIEEKDIPYIFDRFYRADTSRSKVKIDGYGLGLSIAKSIVEVHKGEIKVKSSTGQGSTFIVTFPA